MKRVAVLDPGRCKCGLVLADLQLGLVREGHVLAPEAVEPGWSSGIKTKLSTAS